MSDVRSRLLLKLFRLAEKTGQDGAALEAALAGMAQAELVQLEQSLRCLLDVCAEKERGLPE